MKKAAGLTLIELMVTSAVISIGVVAMMASFRYITTSIQYSKGKSLGNNLVTEQVEKLKNLQYYSLLVTTTNISSVNSFASPLVYDLGNYPPQTLIQGGISFTRYTRIDFAYQYGTAITTAPYTTNDTGLKMITVYVVWKDDRGLQYQEIHNLMANPAANALNASFTGTVTDSSGGGPVAGAVVKTIDNPNFYGIAATGTGQYSVSVSSGNYTLNCSSQGYFSADKPGTVASGGSTPVNFTLTKMASGTASGYAYVNTHLVVSEVVISTDTNVEYVEIYNPTPSPINIGTVWPSRTVDLYIFDPSNNTQPTSGLQPVPLIYISTYVPAYQYYLFANTTTESYPCRGPNPQCGRLLHGGLSRNSLIHNK